MVSVSRVPTSAQSPWHCLSPPGLPTLSSSSLPNLHSPPLSSSLPRPGSGLPTSAQSSVYHPPPATQLYYRPPITSQPIKVTFPIKLLFFSPYNFQRADNFPNDWLTYYWSCWECGCECGPGPQCCLQDWDTQSRERRVWPVRQRERMVGREWAALGSLRHITLHYGRKLGSGWKGTHLFFNLHDE